MITAMVPGNLSPELTRYLMQLQKEIRDLEAEVDYLGTQVRRLKKNG